MTLITFHITGTLWGESTAYCGFCHYGLWSQRASNNTVKLLVIWDATIFFIVFIKVSVKFEWAEP